MLTVKSARLGSSAHDEDCVTHASLTSTVRSSARQPPMTNLPDDLFLYEDNHYKTVSINIAKCHSLAAETEGLNTWEVIN